MLKRINKNSEHSFFKSKAFKNLKKDGCNRVYLKMVIDAFRDLKPIEREKIHEQIATVPCKISTRRGVEIALNIFKADK